MKKLLYFLALAVMFFSCSVENLQDENSIDFTNEQTKAEIQSCISIDLLNSSNEFRGTAEAIIDDALGTATIRLTIYDWKLNQSKLYFGPISDINSTKPDLFGSGKYDYTESYLDGVFIANYEFLLTNVNKDFALLAIVSLDNGKYAENAWTDGEVIPGVFGENYYPDFLKNCIK